MARSSVSNDQLSLGPMSLNNVEDGSVDLKKVENGEALRIAGRIVEEARVKAGLSRQEACYLLAGPGAKKPISEAQYSRWVSGAANDTLPLWRLLFLPAEFWIEFIPQINELKGLRRLVVARFLGVAADLALTEGR